MKVLIVDFDDSFTFNLAHLMNSWGISFDVISYTDLDLGELLKMNPHTVIWGPGPGHPKEYSLASKVMAHLLRESNIFQIGVCLGHQLILSQLGFVIGAARPKRHGISANFKVPNWPDFDPLYVGKELEVQFYNSLSVLEDRESSKDVLIETATIDGQIVSSKGKGFLSFQFHPESVGTSCPEVLFFGWKKSLL